MDKILIAMSGGVDSSVAAYLLTQQGHNCVGATMKLYDGADTTSGGKTCCALDDVEDARSVAYRLGIPYYVFNFSHAFHQQVMERFVAAYRRGITPNPCIDCNRYMKFELLYERARLMGCNAIATGHYARIIQTDDGRYQLKKAVDPSKDQSYVLYSLTQEQLAHTRFPLGELTKAQTRAIAQQQGFYNAHKADSQDICFVPDGDYAGFIERHTGASAPPGNFVDLQGNVLGQHRGIIRYTVGQNRGLGLSLPEKRYVYRICAEDNTVILSDNQSLYRHDVYATQFNWIQGAPPASSLRCKIKIRYRQIEQWGDVTCVGEDAVHIHFDEAVRAITPGQAAVFYDGDTVLGGGVIEDER